MPSEGPRPDDGAAVPLSDEKAVLDVLAKSVLGLWDTVDTLTRLRPTRRDRYRVTFFGSARVAPDHWGYGLVRDVSAELARLGCDIVTGGGPGLMRAANEGARLGAPAGRSVGIRVDLPFEQDVNAFATDVYEHKTFFSRLHHFVLVSDAFVVCPGGIGTVLETLMVWQLLQVRHLRDVPLVLAGEFWTGLVDWAREAMLRPDVLLATPEDLSIPVLARDSADVIRVIRDHHARWEQGRPGGMPRAASESQGAE